MVPSASPGELLAHRYSARLQKCLSEKPRGLAEEGASPAAFFDEIVGVLSLESLAKRSGRFLKRRTAARTTLVNSVQTPTQTVGQKEGVDLIRS